MLKCNYMYLLSSRFFISFGAAIQSIALPILIFSITNSTELLALTFIFETIPWLFIAPFISSVIMDKTSSKKLYISCNIFRAIFTFLLALTIKSQIMTVFIFFVLGILNSLIAALYSKLIKNISRDQNISTILGLSMGMDDAISVIAPIFVLFVIQKGGDGKVFIYTNAVFLMLSATVSLGIQNIVYDSSTRWEERKKNSTFVNIFYNLKTLLEPQIIYLVISEGVRSLVEGMCIPLLISYVITVLHETEILYTRGQSVGAIFQVIMSIVYIYLVKRFKTSFLIDGSTIMMIVAFLALSFSNLSEWYLASMVVLGSGMAIRQLVGQNSFISSYEEYELSGKITAFNSVIAFCYLLGYALAYVLPFIIPLRLIMVSGAVLMIIPICMKSFVKRPIIRNL